MSLEAVRSVGECRGVRLDGEPCGSSIVGADGFCFAHDPARDRDRAEARRRGGRGSSKLRRARRLTPPALLAVFDRLEQALEETHSGELAPHRAAAMASLARAMVTVLTAGELEERIRAIEEGLHDLPAQTGR